MDLTPDVLHQQEFREARRGYDMREVDEFLERVAVAVDQLLERLQAAVGDADSARARVRQLEQEVAAEGANQAPSTDETIQRTLLLAQKAADAAVSDAEEQAARLIGRAEQQAEFVLKEAGSAAERSRLESESQARRAGEETRRRILEEITTLERTREVMQGDVRALRRYLDDQRTRMRTAARDLQRLVEDPTALKEFAPPVTSDRPPPEQALTVESEHIVDLTGAAEADEEPAPERAAARHLPPPPPVAEPQSDVRRADAFEDHDEPDEVTRDEDESEHDGDYFEQLRRAMSDEGGAGS
ncbi:MAG TPA: DivIVA domain-containing protein [Acidimicrobiales bacterium]|nr:DivIVA domain-containing protein [Acidimicrobiales bacterium]